MPDQSWAISLFTAVRHRREQLFMCNFRGIRTRLLSDRVSDYRVAAPYIQTQLHGSSSRLVLDFDGSPTVLRDEEVAGSKSCHPDTAYFDGLSKQV